jgi:tRNA(fMet)-specific endonuclease VapC
VYLLDTDITSNLLDPRRSSTALKDRIRSQAMDEICISIVTVEEMMRGALDEVRRAQSRRRDLVEGYAFFQRLNNDLHRFAILPYTTESNSIFDSFSPSIRRLGGADCRIAAIALAHSCTLVTANMRHFSKIPGLIIEDWTLE